MISSFRYLSLVLLAATALPSLADAQHRHLDGGSALSGQTSVSGERVFDIPVLNGQSQHVLYAAPARPRGTVVMLPGGAGDVGLERDGDVGHDSNFVVRTRALWVARGYAVLIPDALDHANLRGLRSSPQYAGLIRDLVDYAHSQAPGPVYLVGTSQGAIAAMNGAAHARPGSIAGVVLSESVSRLGGSHETVFDADPGDVRVPALIVANSADRCDVAPPSDAPRIVRAMIRSPSADLMLVSGGITQSRKTCGSLTPHGYYGIEPQVVSGVTDWMANHGARPVGSSVRDRS